MNLDKTLSRLINPFAPAEGPPPTRLVPFSLWALKGSWRAQGLAVIVVILAAASEMAVAWFTGRVVDAATTGTPGSFWAQFWPLILAGGLFYMLIRPLILGADSATGSMLIEPHVFPLVLSRINRHTLGHSMRFFDNDFAGRISQKQMQTARSITAVVVEVIDVVIYAGVMFAVALALMGGIDAWLLSIYVVWGVLYAFALRWFIPRVQARAKARAGARTQVTGQIVDTLSNMTTVKLFAHDGMEDRAAIEMLEVYRGRAIHFGAMAAAFRLVLTTLSGILPLFSILGALYLWSRGTATPGDIAMTAMVAVRLSQITQRLGRSAMAIFSDLGEVQDGMETLAPAHEIVDRPGASDQAGGPGAIRFEGVTFSYGGDGRALTEFDLDIKPGEKVALVGASGAGKSTVTSLLLRLYDMEQGRILLDGQDIRDLTQGALRRQVAVVRQETAMFNRSALENIRYGRPEASDEEVFAAARAAAAHEFILNLRDHKGRTGYEARLGERGVKLSGGQRQRIALARAFLKDAPVLVLDEATSALDSEVEAQIQEALGRVMEGKTILAIAHRLSTIAQMDRIVVLDAGRIVEQGSHDELLARGGLYARYWARQSGGFLLAEEAAE